MKRDTLKTVAGLAIIGIIVAATFVYGNAQRQAQLKRDQEVKHQQEVASKDAGKVQPSVSATPVASASPTSSPAASVAPTPSPSSAPSAASNTAPVQSPSPNSLQGSGGTGQQVAGAQTTAPVVTPVTGGSEAPLPEAGSPLIGMIGLAAMAGAGLMVRRSRLAIRQAARSRR